MQEILPKRKHTKLQNYDYSKEGYYFITICTKDRRKLLGEINEEKLELSREGMIVQKNIERLKNIYDNVTIDEYVIMPNHIHIILQIKSKGEVTVPRVINQYKGKVCKEIGRLIWQKLFYEHVIRNEKEYYKVKEYIQNNVINWNKDCYF